MAATFPPDATLSSRVTIAPGVDMPWLGFGVYQARRGRETEDAVAAALRFGYRHIDTASIYGNEDSVGRAIAASGLPRSDLFVTTKLWNSDHGHARTLAACEKSLARLGLAHVDLYLIHWPVRGLRLESWRAMEELHERKLVRAIGVSNYMEPHLEELLAACRIRPAVNQIEVSPFLQQRSVRALCAREGITVEAYSPLTQGLRLDHPVVVAAARALGRTPAQVLLRWALERNTVPLPKSVTEARIRDNAALFDFRLGPHAAALDQLEEELHTGWDPTDAP
ncbi:MAG: aldo/keto reductase [Deltaproteobacteria bacterium]|nr:aldo/keto reductase [Deltaproteobacteria bacterium]